MRVHALRFQKFCSSRVRGAQEGVAVIGAVQRLLKGCLLPCNALAYCSCQGMWAAWWFC